MCIIMSLPRGCLTIFTLSDAIIPLSGGEGGGLLRERARGRGGIKKGTPDERGRHFWFDQKETPDKGFSAEKLTR